MLYFFLYINITLHQISSFFIMLFLRYITLTFIVFFIHFNLLADEADLVKTNPDDFETSNFEDEIYDPLEPVNRAIFKFNNVADRIVLEPIAKGYRKLPSPVQSGLSNFLSNLRTPLVAVNQILQGQGSNAIETTGRFVVNSTAGVLGLIDVAEKIGLEEKEEDYGQTLATWGVGEGCYLVLPVLGPSTARDTVASVVNFIGGDAWYNITVDEDTHYVSDFDYYASRAMNGIDFRAKNIESFDNLEKNSIDFYASVKSLYIQDRRKRILNSDEVIETLDDSDWEEIDAN